MIRCSWLIEWNKYQRASVRQFEFFADVIGVNRQVVLRMNQMLSANQTMSVVTGYVQLTKPSIMLLVLFTGTASMVLEGSLLSDPAKFILVLVGLYLTGGSANALNQYLERDIDARMSRTRKRRPLPQGRLRPAQALVFSVSIGLAGVLIFGLFFNWLTATLALGTILFYALYYTLWLKPNTPLNIVIGGIAGAMAPVGAWTAATGSMDIAPWILFLIVFLWTPPHFWALALVCKDDYRRVRLPMLPLIKGDEATWKQILIYTLALVAASFSLIAFGGGWLYLVAAFLLGGVFIRRTFLARKLKTERLTRGLFGYSIVYLLGLFLAIIVDGLI